jgi:Uma2 family endonuclease
MATVPSPVRRVNYPESDGKPMAETEAHLLVMFEVIGALRQRFAADPNVWVGGNQLLYWEEGNPRKSTSPDVMVSFGIPKLPPRRTYLVWVEGKAPDVAIELTSPSTRRQDESAKLVLYRDVLKVREYFLFDPLKEYLKPSLKGFRLHKGAYVPVTEADGRLPSELLGVHLEREDWHLRLYDPLVKSWLKTPDEAVAQLYAEEAARKKAEAALKKEADARKKAEAAQRRTEKKRQASEQARLQSEAENERLRRELEELRRRLNGR